MDTRTIIAANSVVTKGVSTKTLVGGNPEKVLEKYKLELVELQKVKINSI